jgi:translocation and assembly module TamB
LLPFTGERVRALGITGKVTAAISVVGPLAAPEMPWGVVILDNVALVNTSAVRAKLEGSLVAGLLSVERVWIADTRGELLRGGLVARLPLDEPPETVAGWLAAVAREPWQAHLELSERRVDGWPRPLAKYVPSGVIARGVWDIASDGHAVMAHLDAAARWDEPATRDDCAEELRPALELTADTDEHGVTHGHFAILVDGAVAASATTTSRTPVQAWLLGGELPAVPATLADLELRGLALERLPWTCRVASGEVGGHVRATLFSSRPDLDGELYVAGLRVRADDELPPSAPYRAQLRVRAPGEGLGGVETCLVLGREDGGRTPLARCPRAETLAIRPDSSFAEDGEMIAVASVPMRFLDGALQPEIAWDEPFFALLDARMAQLEPLLAAVPGIAQANATAEGTVWARGPWEALAYEGALRVSDGEARVLSMGQYLHDVGGPLRFEADRIVIPDSEPWRAWDGERAVSLFGTAWMRGLVPVHVEATARPEGFPFRREGSVLAELSGEVGLDADIERSGVEGVVTTGELTISLPQTTVGAVQDLALLPEVLVIGEDGPELGRDRHVSFPYRLRVDALRPFTVSRNDFEVRVSSTLAVIYDEPDLRVGGVANIERGTFEVLGKRFSVARGALAFDGTTSLDPAVDLVATYEIPGRPGATVSILASGTLSNLVVDFQSTESSDTGEILALLVSGRACRATDVNTALRAGQQAASFLTGLAGGLLTLSLREQFGSLVPTISLEDGGLGTVAARVGWDVDWIIPDFLREIVLGAYFEGTFGSRSATGGVGGGVGVGVTMELQFPFNFTASGSYLVPSNGSVDLLWDAF